MRRLSLCFRDVDKIHSVIDDCYRRIVYWWIFIENQFEGTKKTSDDRNTNRRNLHWKNCLLGIFDQQKKKSSEKSRRREKKQFVKGFVWLLAFFRCRLSLFTFDLCHFHWWCSTETKEGKNWLNWKWNSRELANKWHLSISVTVTFFSSLRVNITFFSSFFLFCQSLQT